MFYLMRFYLLPSFILKQPIPSQKKETKALSVFENSPCSPLSQGRPVGFVVTGKARIAGSQPEQAGRKDLECCCSGACPGMSIFLFPFFQAGLEILQ